YAAHRRGLSAPVRLVPESCRRSTASTLEVRMKRVCIALMLASALGLLSSLSVVAETAKKEKEGKWQTADGNPTYNIASDGTVDWYTFSGFRRYHSECHVCHGPDGEGSTYSPALVGSLKAMSYADFLAVVAGGRTNGNSVMPALGDNANVACYMYDLYVYLRARANDAVGRGRPPKKEDKPEVYTKAEDSCMGKK